MIVGSRNYYLDTRDEANELYLHLSFEGKDTRVWPPVYVVTVPKKGVAEPKWLVIVTEHADEFPY